MSRPRIPLLLDWSDIAEAPELASLAGLHSLLEISITALLAAHPELECSTPAELERAPPPLWLAEVILEAAATLRVYLDRYEAAVRQQRHLFPEPDPYF